jgi:hypothetical protein
VIPSSSQGSVGPLLGARLGGWPQRLRNLPDGWNAFSGRCQHWREGDFLSGYASKGQEDERSRDPNPGECKHGRISGAALLDSQGPNESRRVTVRFFLLKLCLAVLIDSRSTRCSLPPRARPVPVQKTRTACGRTCNGQGEQQKFGIAGSAIYLRASITSLFIPR